MGEADGISVGDEDTRVERGLQGRLVAGDAVDERARRAGDRGSDRDRLPRGGGECTEAVAEELTQPVWDRQRLGRRVGRVGTERAAQLKHEERVPARHLVHPPQRRGSEDEIEPSVQQPVGRAQAQWPDGDPLCACRLDQVLGDRNVRPRRHQEPYRVLPQSPPGEREHDRRRAVEPLDVIESEKHWASPAEKSQSVQEPEPDRPLVRRRAARPFAQQGDAQSFGLRCGQAVEDLVEDVVQHVAQRGERHLDLSLDGERLEHPEATGASQLHAGEPEGRLPRSGRAFEHERRTLGRRRIDERRNGGYLGLTAEHQ